MKNMLRLLSAYCFVLEINNKIMYQQNATDTRVVVSRMLYYGCMAFFDFSSFVWAVQLNTKIGNSQYDNEQ